MAGETAEGDLELAGAIFDALRALSPAAMVQGHPEKGPTIIDGRFDLMRLAAAVRKALADQEATDSPRQAGTECVCAVTEEMIAAGLAAYHEFTSDELIEAPREVVMAVLRRSAECKGAIPPNHRGGSSAKVSFWP